MYSSFYNGGILFSTGLLSAIAMISLYTFLLLVETRNKVSFVGWAKNGHADRLYVGACLVWRYRWRLVWQRHAICCTDSHYILTGKLSVF